MTKIVKLTKRWTLLLQRPSGPRDLAEFGLGIAVTNNRAQLSRLVVQVIVSVIVFGLGFSLERR